MSMTAIGALQQAAPLASSLEATSAASDKTTIVTMADGETVKTVRNKDNQIVSITTTPATRPPEIKKAEAAAAALSGRIDVTA